jgi:hypothetical protein
MCVLSGHPTVSWRCKRTRNVRGQSRPPGAALLIRSRPRYGTKGTRLAIEHWFDSLNRTLTDEAPRRGLLRSASALLAGLALGAASQSGSTKKKKKKGGNKDKDKNKGKGNGNGKGDGKDPRCGGPSCAEQWPDDPDNRNECELKCGRCRIPGKFCIVPPDDSNPHNRATCCKAQQTCCPDINSDTGESCVDTDRDPLHCGACNFPCLPDEVCIRGTCQPYDCANLGKVCDGVCTDPDTDAWNCGGCGKQCGPGQICRNAQCKCEIPEQEYCGPVAGCRWTTGGDHAHCGACHRLCTLWCSPEGTCECPPDSKPCGASICIGKDATCCPDGPAGPYGCPAKPFPCCSNHHVPGSCSPPKYDGTCP